MRRGSPGLLSSILLVVAASLLLGATTGDAQAARASQVRTESSQLLNEGVAAYNRGAYAEAVDKLRRCAATALSSFRANYYLGLALIGDRRYEEAVLALGIALDLDPNFIQAHVALGDAHLKRGDIQEATAAYYRALKLRVEYPPALDGIARVYESQADYEKALSFLNRAIANNKGYADAYTHLGDIYLRQGRLDDAVRLLVEAISIRPDFAAGLNRLALAYSRLGLRNEAVATVQKAIGLEPASADHRVALGQILLGLDMVSGAEEAFRKSLALDPGLPAASEGLAEIARRRGEYDLALQHLAAVLDDPRTESSTREHLLETRQALVVERDRVADLEARASKSGTASPGDSRALAAIYAGRGLWIRAADLQASSSPTAVERERLAYYLLRGMRFRAAHVLYSEIARGAGRADLEVNDGVALSHLGDDLGALEAYRRALTLDSSHDRARLYEANTLLRLGKTGDAVAAFKRYIDAGGKGESAELIRRILSQLAPNLLPPPSPLIPTPSPESPESATPQAKAS